MAFVSGRWRTWILLGHLAVTVIACAGPEDFGPGDEGEYVEDGKADRGSSCPRLPAPEDRARIVLVSHPFTPNTFEILSLSSSGTLSATGRKLSLGRAVRGEIVFTPDGKIAL